MAPFTLVARLKESKPTARTALARGRGRLADLVAEGRAEAVFESDRLTLSLGKGRGADLSDLPRIFTIESDSHNEVTELLASVSDDPAVDEAYVAPPRLLYSKRAPPPRTHSSASAPPNWWLRAIRLNEARKLPSFVEANDVVVAVIDSGVDETHLDLQGAVVDSINLTSAPDRDSSGHGTHVSGIIAGRQTHRTGVDGVCRCKILALKALDPYEPRAYYRALAIATSRALVINLSLGGREDATETLLIQRAIGRGVTVVAAMGNEREFDEDLILYPAAIDGVVAVGAIDHVRELASFSSTGPHIALVAPGVGIRSCVPTYQATLAKHLNYDTWDGTSMATPFVSAAVALLLAKAPGHLPADIRSALRTTSCKGQMGFGEEFGHGLLDLAATLA